MSQQPPNPTRQTSPRAWAKFIKANRICQGNYRNLVGDYGHLAKWHVRFRLAKSFQGLNLGLSSNKINTICTLTSDFLLETMDNDFEKRVNEAITR